MKCCRLHLWSITGHGDDTREQRGNRNPTPWATAKRKTTGLHMYGHSAGSLRWEGGPLSYYEVEPKRKTNFDKVVTKLAILRS
ncbi:Holliday Junction Recognition Protein [Manis pentadactyla]|nr:Holliday Junction Recognition Protein [Manis pentadactyla]